MEKNDFKMYNYISDNFAENNNAAVELKPLYRIAIWLPAIVAGLYGLISGIVVLCLQIDTLIKIIFIVGIVIVTLLAIILIEILQSITRLTIFHAERTNYNTSKMQYQLNQIIAFLNEEQINKDNSKSSTASSEIQTDNDKFEMQYMLTINALDFFITNQIVDDEKFKIYINSLNQLGDYKKSKEFITHYTVEYSKLKNKKVIDESYDTLMNKITDLFKQNKISKDKYNEYVLLLENINKIKDKSEKENSYKKLEIILSMY